MSDGGDCRTAPATPGLLINDEAVYRTAPATPGLLTTYRVELTLNVDKVIKKRAKS